MTDKLFNVLLEKDLDLILAESRERAELEREAQQRIDEADADPTQQQYFYRLDKKSIVRTDSEYHGCVSHRVPLRIVSYSHAVQIMKEEDARKRRKLTKKKARKAARVSKKRNRK